MKKFIFLILTLLVSTELFSQYNFWGKRSYSLPTITDYYNLSTSVTSAFFRLTVFKNGGSVIRECGVLAKKSGLPTIGNYDAKSVFRSRVLGTQDGSYYQGFISGLEASTSYFTRGYAINEAGIIYTDNISITTSSGIGLPTAVMDYVQNIDSDGADWQGYAINAGGGTISDKGFCWNTTGSPTKSDSYISIGSGNGSFNYTKNGLSENTTYYVTAYATNEAGTAYSSHLSFTTTGSCYRGSGLTNYNFIDVISINGASSVISGSLSAAKQAAFDYNSKMGRIIGYSGHGGQVSGAVAIGKTVYDGWNKTDCSVLSDGYYLFLENDVKLSKVLHITSGVIDLFEDAIKIGDSFGGGIIGYVLQSGDTGYSSSDVNGYIVATSDQSSGIKWGCLGTVTGVYSGQWIGDSNTATILSICNERPIATSVASSYNGGGFTDWFLPTATELYLFVANHSVFGFSNAYYWGAEETVPNNGFGAGSIQMNTGVFFGQSKNSNNRVRAVRKF